MPNYVQGPLIAVTGSSVSNRPGDSAWSNPQDVGIDDGASLAVATLGTLYPNIDSQSLVATNFGFTIPVVAIIQGIQFTIKKDGTVHGGDSSVDNGAFAVKSGVQVGTDNSQLGSWPTLLTQFTYGGPTDLWGTTWAVSDITNSGFGFAISAENNGASSNLVRAGAVYATVWYQVNTGSASNGGVTPFERIGLYPMSDGNLYAFDPNSGFNDPTDGSSYFWRVEEIAVGRKPTISRIWITYRDLGRVTTVWTLTGVQDDQTVVTNSVTKVLGNVVPTGMLLTAEVDLPLSGMNLQLSVSKAAGAGPLSIAKIKITGRVETDSYS